MKKEIKVKNKTAKPNLITRQYYLMTGYNSFRMISVYQDKKIAIGSVQKFNEGQVFEVKL